jgi:hypothetical protein
MARMTFAVGDKVLVSRAETGDDHELAEVVDSYELIIGSDRRPIVVVEFEDGERKYMTAATPNVLPGPEPEDEGPEPGNEEPGGESTDEAEAAELEGEDLGDAAEGDSGTGPAPAGEPELVYADDEEGAAP